MSDWRIWAESTPISLEEGPDRIDMLLDQLAAKPDVLGPVGWGGTTSLGAVFEVQAKDLQGAAAIGLRRFIEALGRATKGIDDVTAQRFEIAPSDWQPDELLGATDVARVLGVSRQRVYQLLHSFSDFPRPAAQPSRGAVWSRQEIEEWRDRRNVVPWIVKLAMHITGRPPRVRAPDGEQMNRMVDELLTMHDAHRRQVQAGWRSERDLWARFVVDARSQEAAGASAADLVKHKAQYGAQIATVDDLDVEILAVEALEKP